MLSRAQRRGFDRMFTKILMSYYLSLTCLITYLDMGNPISSQIVKKKKICKGYILSTMKLTSLREQLQHVLFNVRYLISFSSCVGSRFKFAIY